jgi:hypothetical protein
MDMAPISGIDDDAVKDPPLPRSAGVDDFHR